MDKTQLKRHDLVFVSSSGKEKIWRDIAAAYSGDAWQMARDVLLGDADVPGFVRRSDERPEMLAVGFVHHQRLQGNRLRIGAFTTMQDIVMTMTPYEVMQRRAFAFDAPNLCMETLLKLYSLAAEYDLQIGALGSAALELATDLPYTDDESDIDLLIKPAAYEKLLDFYRTAQENFGQIKLDFELDLPNGYGVKLPEIFADTRTLLGKSLDDVNLLYRADIMKYLN
ncbi:MAG: malonate decarboxylase holo-[acyl-carrier-protein] synthase [Phascolarctobacterium sp.]|uniref:malonate decarboxylase holo-[acyl-carrier-protein] synthase n=1 Tax=Phascolarctobacterium sp. TaxID=2049039 RepID=UPI0026DC6530|nr:malonate decarboxylase holo-[acyl-carrier-protein] synthase [Phascolarctobacterium sp.]MDO4921015.1 malonate decarboxylase holo-[acyl-carrier-protein] synthase [Phascolarctobacterium sp.]